MPKYDSEQRQGVSLGQCCGHGLFKFHRVSLFLSFFVCLFVCLFVSLFYMLTLRIRPVLQSSSIWVSTALATFACKRKPLMVYLVIAFSAIFISMLTKNCPDLNYMSMMNNAAAPSYFNGGTFSQYKDYR